MKRFMETNKVTHNLMSFSGFKSLLIFSLLVEEPKSYSEIQTALEENEYLHETVSYDTIRIYINSLKEAGCEIKRKKINKQTKFYVESHPFKLKISDAQAKSVIKIYKAISKSIEISDYLVLQKFFLRLAKYITNKNLKAELENISPLSNINPQIIKDLLHYTANKTQIRILYNSPNSGIKGIDVIADKLNISRGKLYLSGYNSEHKNYYSFPVAKIIRIISANINSSDLKIPVITVQYEFYKTDNSYFETIPEEKIIKQYNNKLIIEISSKNKFIIIQRILSLADKCKVLSPSDFREEIISYLKRMKEGYFDEKQ